MDAVKILFGDRGEIILFVNIIAFMAIHAHEHGFEAKFVWMGKIAKVGI
jgi:hypothetical protein